MSNIRTQHNGFSVSYLPDQHGTMFQGMGYVPDDSDETALIIPNQPMRILVGDWREGYVNCETAIEAVDFFSSKRGEHRSTYSEDNLDS